MKRHVLNLGEQLYGGIVLDIKQVIVVRRDLKNYKDKPVSVGKLCAQSAHASLKIFFDRFDSNRQSFRIQNSFY